jgi:hypothetical protein
MNVLLALLGWLAWNFGLFSIEKDKADDEGKPFSVKHYTQKYWDNWLLSLLFVPILVIIGIKGLGFAAIPIGDFKDLKWNDLYYLGSGFFSEFLKISIVKLWRKWNTK